MINLKMSSYFTFFALVLSAMFLASCQSINQPKTPVENGDKQVDLVQEQVKPTPADSAPINPNATDQNSPTLELVATESGQLAIDLLASNAQIETIDYGDAGKFVTNINGIAADNEHYWAFYVNEEYAEQGASQTKLVEGDIIKFVYETIWPSE